MNFATSPEFAPMSGIDEYLIHNMPAPQRRMYTSDPRAFERIWFTAQDRTGDLFVVCGLGFYPNLDTADGYAIVVHRGHLRYVRFHRRLGLDRTDMRMGPLNWTVVAPFKTWTLTLDDNPHGIRYELHWHDTKRPVYSHAREAASAVVMNPPFPGGIDASKRHPLETAGDQVGYEGFGVIEGWVEFAGQRHALVTKMFRGSRDHHWGVRAGVGGFDSVMDYPQHCGQWVDFEDWSVWGSKNLRPIGDPLSGAGRWSAVDRQLRFDEDTGEFREAIITNVADTGEMKELHFRRMGVQTAYLRCGGYGPSTPDGGGIHGVYPGRDTLYGGAFDLNDPKVRMGLGDTVDHHCEVSCGTETTYGLLECLEPRLKRVCEEGRPGFRFLT